MPDVGRKGEGTHVQSIITPKSDWTEDEARAWLQEYFYVDGMDETDTAYHWRQVDPEEDRFVYHTEESASTNGKPVKFVYGGVREEIRSVTFRGRVTGAVGARAAVAIRAAAGVVSALHPVCVADCGNHVVQANDVVLVRCEYTADTIHGAEVVAVSLMDAEPYTAEQFSEAVKRNVPDHVQATRSAPIVGHRIAVDPEGEGRDRQLITVVVYEPGRMDVGWDTTASPEMVEAWAHGCMISMIALRGQVVTDHHWLRDDNGDWVLRDPDKGDIIENGKPVNRVPAEPVDAYVVESWLKRCGCPVNDVPVSKGAWLAELWIRDPAVWQRILDGEFTGVSIEFWKPREQNKEVA